MTPHFIPPASKIAASRCAVVVLPFVPVMPTTRMRSLGCPWKSAASSASARRASATRSIGTPMPASGCSETTATAPRSTACRANVAPSAWTPLSATNTPPGSTARESYAMPVIGWAVAVGRLDVGQLHGRACS